MGAASGLVATLACGPAVSLDAAVPLGSSSGTAGGSTGNGTQSSGDSGNVDTTTTSEPPSDLPPSPLPGECPPGCEVDLPLTWTWEDEAIAPDPLPQERRLTAMITMPDGGWVVAEQRDGLSWLTRVEPDGSLGWSVLAALSCDCEIVDLALYPSGQLAVLGEGTLDDFYSMLVFGRFDPGSQTFAWKTWDVIYGTEAVPPRVGSVIPIDEIYTAVIVIEAGWSDIGYDEEWTEIYYYENDYISNYHEIDSRLVSATVGPPPRGVRLSGGELAVALPDYNDRAGYMVWLGAGQLDPIDAEIVPFVAEAMALGADDAVMLTGQKEVSPQQVVLQVASASRAHSDSWAFSTGVLTTSPSTPAVAVDAAGSAIVALRTTAGTPEEPSDPSVELMRLHQGSPVWSTSVPMAVEDAPRPIAIASTDDDGLVLAGIVDGHLHLERREQDCRCE